jgi:hypothetical protein
MGSIDGSQNFCYTPKITKVFFCICIDTYKGFTLVYDFKITQVSYPYFLKFEFVNWNGEMYSVCFFCCIFVNICEPDTLTRDF